MNNKNKTPKVSRRISARNLKLQEAVKNFFIQIGEDPLRDGIKETPRRFEKAIKYLLSGLTKLTSIITLCGLVV